MRDTLENMCSGKQPSRSYSNQNQTEDFGGLKFYDVVGNQKRIFVGEKKVYYKETAEGQAGSEYTEFFFKPLRLFQVLLHPSIKLMRAQTMVLTVQNEKNFSVFSLMLVSFC